MDLPNWCGLLLASGAGFVIGVLLTVAYQTRVAIRVDEKLVQVPRWTVLVAAVGAAIAVGATTMLAVGNPSALNLVVALSMMGLFGAAGLRISRGQ